MVTIRAATPQDMAWVQGWMPHSAWESLTTKEQAIARPEGIILYTQGLLQTLLSAPQQAVILIAEMGGQNVGYLLAGPAPDSTTGEIHGFMLDLFVVPPMRRRGIARQLHAAAEQSFRQMGLRKVKIWSSLENKAAIRIAEASGFKPEGLIGAKEW